MTWAGERAMVKGNRRYCQIRSVPRPETFKVAFLPTFPRHRRACSRRRTSVAWLGLKRYRRSSCGHLSRVSAQQTPCIESAESLSDMACTRGICTLSSVPTTNGSRIPVAGLRVGYRPGLSEKTLNLGRSLPLGVRRVSKTPPQSAFLRGLTASSARCKGLCYMLARWMLQLCC